MGHGSLPSRRGEPERRRLDAMLEQDSLLHGFLAGLWPVKEFGLTSMDYTRAS